jgi:quinoprotein glucose dehydrogenase
VHVAPIMRAMWRFILPAALALAGACRHREPYEAPRETMPPPAEEARRGMRLAPGFQAVRVAVEPGLGNPVAFTIPARGRFLVAETWRQEKRGVPDNRSFPEWLGDDLRALRVEDRREYYLRHHPRLAREFTQHEDLVREIRDLDGDGLADVAWTFAGGFGDLLDGTGAGLLVLPDGAVLYTCIPHLWRLSDADGDGRADRREPLLSGFGVRTALRGHDLHGLVAGLDGRVYFSIGDRGYHVTTREGRVLSDPRSGAVFRCRPDGRELEVFATGLRNPQELAFDDWGRLFSCDNNSDSEDEARLLYLPEGSDSGWRMNFQSLPRRGPWVEEGWWRRAPEWPAPFRLPPLGHVGSGPAGFCADPGGLLGPEYRGAFFLCDFRGAVGESGVYAIFVAEEGAGFRFEGSRPIVKGILATDVEFGPEGALFVLDWVEGWEGSGRGRIWRLDHEAAPAPELRAAEALLARPPGEFPDPELLEVLGHRDRRVRLRAADLCVARGPRLREPLLGLIGDAEAALLQRLHALWVLARLAWPAAEDGLLPLLEAAEAPLRAHALRALSEAGSGCLAARLHRRLVDPDPFVQAEAAMAAGRLRCAEATWALLDLAALAGDRDPFLRHAAVWGLARAAPEECLAAGLRAADPARRLAALLALRRRASPVVAQALQDEDPVLRLEAGRAIHDLPIEAARGALADRVGVPGDPPRLLRRAILAAEARGGETDPGHLLGVVARADAPLEERRLALRVLARWRAPPERDEILNEPRRIAARAPRGEVLLRRSLPGLLGRRGDPLAEDLIDAAAQAGCGEAAPLLQATVSDGGQPAMLRAKALRALARIDPGAAAALVPEAWQESGSPLGEASLEAVTALPRAEALALATQALGSPEPRIRRAAVRALGRLRDDASLDLLLGLFRSPADPTADLEVALEVREAVEARARAGSSRAKRRLALRGREEEEDPRLREFLALDGGDPGSGRRIFLEDARVACARCHHLPGDDLGLAKAGPPLGGVARRLGRRSLLAAITDPDRDIAQGWTAVALELQSGESLCGRILHEDQDRIVVETLDTGLPVPVEVRRGEVLDRRAEASAMPKDVAARLSLRELRDLVAFLATLD